MKLISTDIVRRIDDLGRVVIPKNIRKELEIHEGDSLEIFKTDEGGIYLKLKLYEEHFCKDCWQFKEPDYSAQPGKCLLNKYLKPYSNSEACDYFDSKL